MNSQESRREKFSIQDLASLTLGSEARADFVHISQVNHMFQVELCDKKSHGF